MYSLIRSWKRFSSLVFTGILFYSASVLATPASDTEQVLDITDIVQILVDQGYQDIHKIELSDDLKEYEVKARNSKGQKVEIELDAANGKIIDIDRD